VGVGVLCVVMVFAEEVGVKRRLTAKDFERLVPCASSI
jgi:hypothetical protein